MRGVARDRAPLSVEGHLGFLGLHFPICGIGVTTAPAEGHCRLESDLNQAGPCHAWARPAVD